VRNKYSGDDVKARLSGTIIRYKKVPYLCEVENSSHLSLYSLEGQGLAVRVESNDPDVDISSLHLGYVNIDIPDYSLAVYLKREPLRQYRQGIDLSRLTQFPLRSGCGPLHHKVLMCKGLVDNELNRYPTLEQAINKITKKSYYSVALSRDVAIKREDHRAKVYVKDIEVGYLTLGTNIVTIPKGENYSKYACHFLNEIEGWVIDDV